jgi:hypothetical protein
VRVVPTSLVAALILGVAAAPAAADTPSVRVVLGVTHDADRAAVVAEIGDLALGWRSLEGLDAITVEVAVADGGLARAAAVWAKDPAVRYRFKDQLLQADEGGDGTLPVTYKQLNRVAGAQTWTTGSPSVTVAVLDSGVTPNADLPAARLAPGYDFVDNDTDPADGGSHGTMMAGVIAGDAGPGALGTGVCPQCRVMPVRVLQDHGSDPTTGYSSDVAAGIAWAVDHGARVVNISASARLNDSLMTEAVAHAAASGVLVVAAAGHGSPGYTAYPANIDPAVAVGTHDDLGRPLRGTNGNSRDHQWLDTSAAAYAVAMDPSGTLRDITGTSPATAVVSGTAALALAMRPDLTVTDLRARLAATSSPAAYSGDAPILDASRLLRSLGAEDSLPPVVTRTGLKPRQRISGVTDTYVTPSATDDHAVERMEMLLGGKVVGTWLPWSRTMRVRAPAGYEGSYPVTIRAYDYAGHVGEQSTTVGVDGVAPTATAIWPPANTRVHGTFVSTINGVHDGTGYVLAELWANGDRYIGSDTTAPYSLTVVDGVGTGTGTLVWKLTDSFGNTRSYKRNVIGLY